MNCCINCFNDRILINIIKDHNSIDECDFCKSCDVYTMEISEISERFAIFLPYYEKLEHSRHYNHEVDDPMEFDCLYDSMQQDWNIFSLEIEGKTAKSLLTEIMQTLEPGFDENELYAKATDAFTYESRASVWESFSSELKYENRFFPAMDIADFIAGIFAMNVHPIHQNAIIYRGRLGNEPIEKMGAPPAAYAKAGRANQKGISYLYAAPRIETCIAELRPYIGAVITIVKMTTNRPLTFVRLNVSQLFISPFQWQENLLENIEARLLYEKLVSDLSKPIGPDNNEIDYLPTQFLSELIKREGYDGFLFESSLCPNQENYVIFDERNVTRNTLEIHEVTGVSYTSKWVPNFL